MIDNKIQKIVDYKLNLFNPKMDKRNFDEFYIDQLPYGHQCIVNSTKIKSLGITEEQFMDLSLNINDIDLAIKNSKIFPLIIEKYKLSLLKNLGNAVQKELKYCKENVRDVIDSKKHKIIQKNLTKENKKIKTSALRKINKVLTQQEKKILNIK